LRPYDLNSPGFLKHILSRTFLTAESFKIELNNSIKKKTYLLNTPSHYNAQTAVDRVTKKPSDDDLKGFCF